MKTRFTEDIQRSLKEISALYRITQQINDSHDIKQIFRILLTILDDVCNYELIALRLYDENTGDIDLEFCKEKNPSQPHLFRIPDEVMDWVLDHKKIRLIPLESIVEQGPEFSLAVIPLISLDRIIGSIQIVMPVSSGSLTPHLEQILWIVASQAAGSIQNARLLKAMVKKNDDLMEMKKYLTSVLDNMIHGVMVLDKKKRITLVSKSMEILFGISSKQAIGQLFTKVFPKDTNAMFKTVLEDIEKNLFVIDREFEHTLSTGKKLPVSITSSLLEMGHKQSGTIFVIKDLSAAKRLIALAEMDRLKSNFVATVSHEFKTPLNLILGSTNLLIEGLVGPLNERQSKLLHLIKDGSDRLMALIKELLNLAKIEAEKGSLSLEQVSLDTIVNRTIKSLKYMADEKNVRIEYNHPSTDCLIVCEGSKIEQMIKNLVDNAIKYSNRDGKVQLSIAPWEKDGRNNFIELNIIDNGIGIVDKEQDDIFNEFHRSNDPEARKREGSGLGLTIAKKIVDLHRGKIMLTSRVGEGTQIKIILPRDLRTL